jgi:hypothetical protein
MAKQVLTVLAVLRSTISRYCPALSLPKIARNGP